MAKGTALITGASSGIGYHLSRQFAKDGWDLVLVARGRHKLEQVGAEMRDKHKINVRTLARDLSEPSVPDVIFQELQGTDVDVLVNNAGYTVFGPFVENDLATELNMIQLNCVALTHLTKLFLKPMVQRKRGRIMNVASTAAFQPGPLMAVYYASKAYVLSFSEAIANELEGSGVTVTALCPGPTETGFQERGQMQDSKLVAGKKIMGPEEVAEAGYKALMAGRAVVIPGAKNQVLAWSVRFTPRGLITRLVRTMQERKS